MEVKFSRHAKRRMQLYKIAMLHNAKQKEGILSLSGTSLAEFNEYAPNNLLQWEVIKFAVNKGLKFYDLGGKGVPSIDKFKASFGAEVHSYFKIVWESKLASFAEEVFLNLKSLSDKIKYKLKS